MNDKNVSTSKTPSMPFVPRCKKARRAVLVIAFSALALPAIAQEGRRHHGSTDTSRPPDFVASTAKPFSALMDDAMAMMDEAMKHAPTNGVAEHDFLTMMIPHHQGAIDMAKAVLLYTKDPELKNLAQGIITEQQIEIRVMQAWLQRHPANYPQPLQ
jgi:uncharacterized protein (DUF305 family)